LAQGLTSPFTINVRETARQSSAAARLPAGSQPEPPQSTVSPSTEWIPISEFYVVIDVDLVTKISITCLDYEPLLAKAKRIIDSVAIDLYEDAFSNCANV
jgi:hypothetical protein